MDAAALSQLLSPEGWQLLNALPRYDERLAIAMSSTLRDKGYDPALIAAALTQSRLRAKAGAKFGGFADGMLFTPAGLEQATRLVVAARHAHRYTSAGITAVADLTCGIGADALAFAGVGLRVLAVDADELTAAVATVNLRHFPDAEVRHGDGLAVDLAAEDVQGVYADPARRTRAGTRVFDPRAYEPRLDDVWALRERVPAVGIKVGPGIPHAGLPADAEAQWVSVDGDVVEAGLWFGPLAPDGPGRSALVLRSEGSGDGTAPDGADPGPHRSRSLRDEGVGAPPVGELGAYLYEPDGAVIRAGLVGQVAAELDGRLVNPTIAYVTTDAHDPTGAGGSGGAQAPLAAGYRVLDSMPFNLKRLRSYLRERGVGTVAIKKRGTAVVPEQLRRQLDLHGDATATLVLTRLGSVQSVIVVEPLGRAADT